MAGDRTEQATPHRPEKAHKDGDILRSRDLSSAAGTLAGVLCLGLLAQKMIDSFRSILLAALHLGSSFNGHDAALKEFVLELRRPVVMGCIPVGIAMAAIV